MKIGIGVEGPSDFQFWNKVLPKYFRSHRFDIRNMKNRDKLIREAPRLIESFKDSKYNAGIILVDQDDDPCISAVVNLFDESMIRYRSLPKRERFSHICVAVKEIESWYLADEEAIGSLMPGCGWEAPEQGRFSKGKLRSLVKTHFGAHATFNEISFAKDIAPKFNPNRARAKSPSFAYFWEVLRRKVKANK